MGALDFSPVWLSLKLATITTLVLLLTSMPLAWWIAHRKSWASQVVSAIVTLPLVLPPTVLGFYLLVFFSPTGWGGVLTQSLGLGALPFTFSGLVVASCIYSLPFAVRPLVSAYKSIGVLPLEVAATLRASPIDRFLSIILPLSRTAVITAMVLTFAHTLGEFGVVLMIGGNIPGETQVLSMAIYEHVESGQYRHAHMLAGGMLLCTLAALLALEFLERKNHRGHSL